VASPRTAIQAGPGERQAVAAAQVEVAGKPGRAVAPGKAAELAVARARARVVARAPEQKQVPAATVEVVEAVTSAVADRAGGAELVEAAPMEAVQVERAQAEGAMVEAALVEVELSEGALAELALVEAPLEGAAWVEVARLEVVLAAPADQPAAPALLSWRLPMHFVRRRGIAAPRAGSPRLLPIAKPCFRPASPQLLLSTRGLRPSTVRRSHHASRVTTRPRLHAHSTPL
jgi:hypothetical protein